MNIQHKIIVLFLEQVLQFEMMKIYFIKLFLKLKFLMVVDNLLMKRCTKEVES